MLNTISIITLFVIVIGFVLTRCKSQSSQKESFESWLELQYPGRFTILYNHVSDPIKNFSFSVNRVFIADKSDPDLQIMFKTDKRQASWGLDKNQLDKMITDQSEILNDCRSLRNALDQNGLQSVKIGYLEGYMHLLFLEYPDSNSFNDKVKICAKVILDWDQLDTYGVRFAVVEEDKGNNLKPIISIYDWFDDNWLIQRKFVLIADLNEEDRKKKYFEPKWIFNKSCDLVTDWTKLYQEDAKKWAEEKLHQTITIQDISEFEPLNKGYGVVFTYYYNTDKKENAGIINGECILGLKGIKNLRLTKN